MHRTVGMNLLHQFGADVSTRHREEPGGRERLLQYVHIILKMTESGNNMLPAEAFKCLALLGDRISFRAWMQRHKETGDWGRLVSLTRLFCRKRGREKVQGRQLKSKTVLRWERRPAAAEASWLQWSEFLQRGKWEVARCPEWTITAKMWACVWTSGFITKEKWDLKGLSRGPVMQIGIDQKRSRIWAMWRLVSLMP